jgi:predicted DNA-binding transcriptional regulator YafY
MRADRLLTIMLLLQSQGKMTTRRLADQLEVSRRTILRDIDALSAAGVPVVAEGGHGGGITLDEHYRTSLAGMKEKEVRTLFIGDNTRLLGEIGLGGAVESAMLKLRAVLPVSHQPAVEHFRQRILIDPVWWWRDEQQLPWWQQLQQAVFENRCIQVVYERNDGEIIERILEPYSLVAKSGVWYLIARQAETLHTYRLLRFRQIALLETCFQRRADFDLPTHWQAQLTDFGKLIADYDFTLRVHPDQMNFIKMIVPGRYHAVESPETEGWVTLQFHLETIDLAKMLIFGLGEHATIVEPQELQDAVLKTANAVLNQHNCGT